MSFIKRIVGSNPPERIRITMENIKYWSKFSKLYDDEKIKFDSTGRARYLHGAPLGELVLNRVNKDGSPIYKESAEGWFDPDSLKAKNFVWP